jgi:hypothetical protein
MVVGFLGFDILACTNDNHDGPKAVQKPHSKLLYLSLYLEMHGSVYIRLKADCAAL